MHLLVMSDNMMLCLPPTLNNNYVVWQDITNSLIGFQKQKSCMVIMLKAYFIV